MQLTDRGQEVVDTASRAVDTVERELEEHLSREQIDAARAVLIAMTEIKTSAIAKGTGRRRSPRELRRLSPILPVRNLKAALAHYQSLGFTTSADERGDYGFANRGRVELHFTVHAGREPLSPASAYLYVRDADTLFAEWSRSDLAGHTHAVKATSYGLREGSHVDPDGNLIRFGSPIAE